MLHMRTRNCLIISTPFSQKNTINIKHLFLLNNRLSILYIEHLPVRKKVQFFETTKCFGKKIFFLLFILCKQHIFSLFYLFS